MHLSEQHLEQLIKQARYTEAEQQTKAILNSSPNNELALTVLIQSLFHQQKFSDCLIQCANLSSLKSPNKIAEEYAVLCLIELKALDEALKKVNRYKVSFGEDKNILLLETEIAICKQDFTGALTLYLHLYVTYPEFFTAKYLQQRPELKQHFVNARNLLKQNAFTEIQPALGVSQRLDSAVKMFFGLEKPTLNHPQQRGSFFNVPGLTAKPYFSVEEVPNLKEMCDEISANIALLESLINNTQKHHYIDTTKSKTAEPEWQVLAKKWQSIHLLKAGSCSISSPDGLKLQAIFNNSVIADCPPHAPEVFISILPPDTFIPPHYGLSNIKLSVHIPIIVDEKSSLTVAGQVKYWFEEDVIVFDDSFLHSAENKSADARAILIFDIWHPELTEVERTAIRGFMANYDAWSGKYGDLSEQINMALKN